MAFDLNNIFPKNIKDKLQKIRADPKAWAKFNLQVVQVVITVIATVIFYQFLKVIIGFNTGNSPMNMVARLITFAIMLWLFYTIYRKSYIPLRDRLMQYNSIPIEKQKPIKDVDTEKIIDKILNKYDNERRSK